MKEHIQADLFDMSVLQNEVRRRAADAGLTCHFIEGLETPGFNFVTKQVHIPAFKPPMTMDDLDYLRGSIIHEIGHANRTETVERTEKNKIDMSKPFGNILNIVEDGAMERGIASEWFGDAISLGKQHDIHIRKSIDIINGLKDESGKFRPLADDDVKVNSAYALGERYRKWDRWSSGTRLMLDQSLPPQVKELTDQLDKAGWGAKMAAARTTDDVFNVAKELYKVLFQDPTDPESLESDQNHQDGKEGGGAGARVESPQDTPKESVTHWRMLNSDHTNTGGTPNPKAKVDYSNHARTRAYGSGLLMPTSIHRPRPHGPVPAPAVPPFVGSLRILLQSEAKNRFEFGLKSGKLDQRKLAKLALPIVPGSDSYQKVFKRRIPGRKINTAIQIMVDGSGSMSGSKNAIASDAADMLTQAFTGPLRIRTAVHGFDTASNQNRIWTIKEFNENVVPGTIAARSRAVGFNGNADGDAVIWALGNIINRPEKRKIILVLSDGMPTDGTGAIDPGSMLKHAIESARKRGVQVYGIGIEDRSVRCFYGSDCKVIKSATELPHAILDTLKSKV